MLSIDMHCIWNIQKYDNVMIKYVCGHATDIVVASNLRYGRTIYDYIFLLFAIQTTKTTTTSKDIVYQGSMSVRYLSTFNFQLSATEESI